MKNKYILLLSLLLLSLPVMAQDEIADTVTNSVKMERLCNTSELSTQDGRLLTLQGLGLFYFDQGTLVSLDSTSCPDIKMCRLKANIQYDDLVMCDGYFIVKSGPFIIMLDGENTRILSKFDTPLFFLYPGGDDYINVVIPEESGEWAWYTFKIYSQKLECVTRMTTPITKVIDNLSHAYVVSEETIYLISELGMEPLITCNRDIIDAASTNLGLFVMCEDALFLANGEEGDIEAIIEEELYGLYNDGDVIYIVMQNGDIFRLGI